ncbi:hypothetical protein LTR27_003686 [Elasticomyces elasticus]|nr:hypothetical protein LTR27_003686 [Elasticomyces elasticus]
MAEFGIASGALQVADAGLKLAKTLYNSSVTSKGRWAWPLKKGKVDMLQANLERLKTTLLLMLSVLSFAKANAKSDPADDSRVAVEKLQIDTLIKAQEDATNRYDELVASFTRLETHVTITTNGFVLMPTAQALPSTTERPMLVDGSGTRPDDVIRSQFCICVSAVSQLAQAFDTAAQSWKSGTNVEFAAINKAFDDVRYHLGHLQRSNQIGLSQRYCDATPAANGPPDVVSDSTRRAPHLPEDERSALVAQRTMQMQIFYSGSSPDMPVMSSHHPPTYDSQGTSLQEQILQDSLGELKQVQLESPLTEQLSKSQDGGGSSMSMDFAAVQNDDVPDIFDGLGVVANSIVQDDGKVDSDPTTSSPQDQAHHTSSVPIGLRESPQLATNAHRQQQDSLPVSQLGWDNVLSHLSASTRDQFTTLEPHRQQAILAWLRDEYQRQFGSDPSQQQPIAGMVWKAGQHEAGAQYLLDCRTRHQVQQQQEQQHIASARAACWGNLGRDPMEIQLVPGMTGRIGQKEATSALHRYNEVQMMWAQQQHDMQNALPGQQYLTRQQQIQREQMMQRQIQQQQSQQQQIDGSSKKRSWSEANVESYCKPEPSISEGGDQTKRSRGQEEVDALPNVADMHTTDDLEVEKTSSAVDALVKRWTNIVTGLGS